MLLSDNRIAAVSQPHTNNPAHSSQLSTAAGIQVKLLSLVSGVCNDDWDSKLPDFHASLSAAGEAGFSDQLGPCFVLYLSIFSLSWKSHHGNPAVPMDSLVICWIIQSLTPFHEPVFYQFVANATCILDIASGVKIPSFRWFFVLAIFFFLTPQLNNSIFTPDDGCLIALFESLFGLF